MAGLNTKWAQELFIYQLQDCISWLTILQDILQRKLIFTAKPEKKTMMKNIFVFQMM